MRLAFVHGINNENNTPADIEADWWAAITIGWADIGLPILPKPKIDVAYYGKLLADATNGHGSDAIPQGDHSGNQEAGAAYLEELMAANNISPEEMSAELRKMGVTEEQVVPQGWIQGALVDTASAIESILINRGQWIASGGLPQATHYIENKGLAAKIGLIVRQKIFDDHDDDLLVVSHSLGTVVMYKLLASDRRVARRNVPLFLTLGSPLGIGMMQQILPARNTIPTPPIAEWVNVYRPDDFVALNRPLVENTIGLDGIENISDGLIEESNKHSVTAYLRSPPVCGRIHTALSAAD